MNEEPLFVNPRHLSDYRRGVPTAVTGALFSYSTLLAITSESPHNIVEALQLLAFLFFPPLPLVQLCRNALAACLRPRPYSSMQLKPVVAGVCGQYVTPASYSRLGWSERHRLVNLDHGLLAERQRGCKKIGWWIGVGTAISTAILSCLSLAA